VFVVIPTAKDFEVNIVTTEIEIIKKYTEKPILALFKLEYSFELKSDIVKKASKQKIIDIDIKINEAKSACITQKQQPKIQDIKPDVQIK